jgi:hypothetical protein
VIRWQAVMMEGFWVKVRRREVTRVVTDIEIWVEVRRRVLKGELSQRAGCRDKEIHGQTLFC